MVTDGTVSSVTPCIRASRNTPGTDSSRSQRLTEMAMAWSASNSSNPAAQGAHRRRSSRAPHGQQANPAQQFLSDVSKPLFTEQIEALVERSNTKRERSGWRRGKDQAPQP